MKDPQGVDLIDAAAALTAEDVRMLAHALGWPTSPHGCFAGVRWRDPYRNGYAASQDTPADKAWSGFVRSKLAVRRDRYIAGGLNYYHVTPLGRAVTMLRVRAMREAELLRSGRAS